MNTKRRVIEYAPLNISFNTRAKLLTNAAWNFAQALLWGEQRFSEDEIAAVKSHLLEYFEESWKLRQSFIAFCERIVLANKYFSSRPDKHFPRPLVWFNRNTPQGFSDTRNIYEQVEKKRAEAPGYLKHITILAKHYYRYSVSPSADIFRKCRERLLRLKANNLLQQFYNVIVHFNYLMP